MNKRKLPLVIFLTIVGTILFIVIASTVTHTIIEENSFSSKESKTRFSEITYEVPDMFEESHYSTFRDYRYNSKEAYLDIEVSTVEKSLYKDADNYIKERVIIKLTDKVSELKEIEINGIKMHTVTVESKNDTTYYYSMETTNYIYLFEFQISDYKNGNREDIDTNPCFTTKEKVLYSIKLK